MREEMLPLVAARGPGAVFTIRDVIEEPLVARAAFDVCLLTSMPREHRTVVATAGGGAPGIAGHRRKRMAYSSTGRRHNRQRGAACAC